MDEFALHFLRFVVKVQVRTASWMNSRTSEQDVTFNGFKLCELNFEQYDSPSFDSSLSWRDVQSKNGSYALSSGPPGQLDSFLCMTQLTKHAFLHFDDEILGIREPLLNHCYNIDFTTVAWRSLSCPATACVAFPSVCGRTFRCTATVPYCNRTVL